MIKAVEFKKSERALVLDDGGLIYSNPDNSGFFLNIDIYDRILTLAKQCEIRIPIACTAIFFDIDEKYSKNKFNPKAERIVRLIQDNPAYLQLWNHGLTHTYDSEYIEYFSYSGGAINQDLQNKHIEASQNIFRSLGFAPDTLVPPGHAWEEGVTDAIAQNYGIRNIAIREFEKTSLRDYLKKPWKRYKKEWAKSNHLNTYYRLGLGITYDQTEFHSIMVKRSEKYIKNTFPNSIFNLRKLKLSNPVDHFFAHVQNFNNPESLDIFSHIIRIIKKEKSRW